MSCWNSEVEAMAEDEIVKLQFVRLRQNLARVYEKISFYQTKMQEKIVKPEDIQSLADVQELPFTTYDDLCANYPYGLIPMPVSGINRFMIIDREKRTAFGYTSHDIEMQTERMARMLVAVGVNVCSIVMNISSCDNDDALAFHYGAEKIGATVIPAAKSEVKAQIEMISEFGVTVLIAAFDELLNIAEYMKEQELIVSELPITTIICNQAECSYDAREKLEELFKAKLYFIYNNAELGGPIAGECCMQDGLHIQQDDFYVEIINPYTGEVLKDGEWGELVITNISAEGTPLIRYRTGDVTFIHRGRCECGRTLIRMPKSSGRLK